MIMISITTIKSQVYNTKAYKNITRVQSLEISESNQA